MSDRNSMFIDRRLPSSKAFQALCSLKTAAPVQVLLLFYEKRKFNKAGRRGKEQFYIANNGQIEFTHIEAEKAHNITKPRFRTAINQLIDTGFLEITEPGGGVHHKKTLYALIDNWIDYGKPNFKPGKRPKSGNFNPGFKPGNQLWRLRKDISVNDTIHDTVNDTIHGCNNSHSDPVNDIIHVK